MRLAGALQLEQDDESDVQRARYMMLETIAPMGEYPSFARPSWHPDPAGARRTSR